MSLQAEDIGFWIFILAGIAVIIWMLIGSPTLENGVLTLGVFVFCSELLLWRNHFKMDKKTTVSFVKLKNDISNINNNTININNKLGNIETLIKK